MSIHPNRVNARVHPFKEMPIHTYDQICAKVCDWFGVENAEHWYGQQRKHIMDGCFPDPHSITKFKTLGEFWENRQMESKWSSPAHNPTEPAKLTEPHAVEIYAVRAVGARGELGVLTTTHDLDSFISGLASATAKYINTSAGKGDIERDLGWIFKNAFPLGFKLAGYKADQVVERHVLMCGSNAPAADDIVASA